jgi:hypothetical protein
VENFLASDAPGREFRMVRRYVGDALLLGLLVQEPDVVLSRFALLRSHVRSHRKTPIGAMMDGRCAIDGKFFRIVRFRGAILCLP